MRKNLIILGLLINLTGFTQTIEELELQLRQTPILELDSVRQICNQIFKLDKYNESAIYSLMESYRYQTDNSPENLFFSGREKADIDTAVNYTDSINIFFQNLINSDKFNPKPYILNAKFQSEGIADSTRIDFLQTAINLDSNNITANYMLGQTYYYIFNKTINEDEDSPQLQDLAYNSYEKLEKTFRLDSSSRITLKFPLIQLANYLNDLSKIQYIKGVQISNSLYFPIILYSKLAANWALDYKTNVLSAAEIAYMQVGGISRLLEFMSEKSLFNTPDSIQVYRFTWIRSFHNKISIDLEKVSGNIMLYWKECNDPYEPTGLKVDSSRKLTLNDWYGFNEKIEEIKFWEMKTLDDEFDGLDGASWILEGFNKKYHLVDRWSPMGSSFQKCCEYLISLTDLKTNK